MKPGSVSNGLIPWDQKEAAANLSLYQLIVRQPVWRNRLLVEQQSPTRQNNRLNINSSSQSLWHSVSQPNPPFSSHVCFPCFILMSKKAALRGALLFIKVGTLYWGFCLGFAVSALSHQRAGELLQCIAAHKRYLCDDHATLSTNSTTDDNASANSENLLQR